MFSTSNPLQHCPHFAGFFIASERLDLDTNDEHQQQQHHRCAAVACIDRPMQHTLGQRQ